MQAAKAARTRKRDADLASNEAVKKALVDFRQTILDKLLDDAAPSTKDKPGAGRPPPPNVTTGTELTLFCYGHSIDSIHMIIYRINTLLLRPFYR